MKTKISLVAIFCLFVMVLTSCSGSPKPGQVSGKLVDAGDRPISDVPIFLMIVTDHDQETGEATLTLISIKAVTGSSGKFVFEGVEPGMYAAITGGDISGPKSDMLRNAEGDVLVFEVPAGEGVDLGTVVIR